MGQAPGPVAPGAGPVHLSLPAARAIIHVQRSFAAFHGPSTEKKLHLKEQVYVYMCG